MVMNTLYKIISVAVLAFAAVSCTTEETEVLLDNLQIVPSDVSIARGETLQLELVFNPDNISDKSVVWSSSDNDIVTVDQEGNIIALQSGNAVVTAISSGVMAVCNIAVNAGPALSLSLDKTELMLAPGDAYQFTVTMDPKDADISSLVWTSSDESVVSIDDTGKLLALKEGKSDIRVQTGDISAVCNVTVLVAPAVGDYFYSDGTWSTDLDENKTVVGVVYYVGDPTIHDKLLKSEHPNCTNGLVVSLQEFRDCFQPGNLDYQAYYGSDNYNQYYIQDWISINCPELQSIVSVGLAMGDSGNLMLGYNNTEAMMAFNDADENAEWPLIPIQKLVEFRETNPLPSNTSGWYLPSSKELYLMTETSPEVNIFWAYRDGNNKAPVNKALEKIDGASLLGENEVKTYWSSTEYYIYGSMIFVDLDLIVVNPGGNPMRVTDNSYRYIFAF